jgi:erythromycin esterase-like protein
LDSAQLPSGADWPDAYRVNRYVRGLTADRNGRDALGAFARRARGVSDRTDRNV